MSAGTTIQHKRKSGAFSNGDLAVGEFGVDTTNDEIYVSYDGSTVVKVGGGKLVDWTLTTDSTARSTSAIIAANDNTIPQQSSDGTAYTDIQTSYTLDHASNSLLFIVGLCVSTANNRAPGCSLFIDSTENAIAISGATGIQDSYSIYHQFYHFPYDPGDTSSHDYKVHYGYIGSSSTVYLNTLAGTAKYGGVAVPSFILILEFNGS